MEYKKENNDIDNAQNVVSKNEISFLDIWKIFVRRKWLFIGFFIVVLAAGLAVTFSTSPLYKTSSNLKFSNVFYDENLYRYFPVESDEIGIYAPGMKSTELENSNLDKYALKMRSDEIIGQVIQQLGISSGIKEVNDSITVIQDKGKRVFAVEVTNPDPQAAYNINQKLFEVFVSEINSGKALEAILVNIENEISGIDEELKIISNEKKDLNDFNISSKLFILNNLEEMKYNLEKNKEILEKKVEITKEPGVPDSPFNLDYKKNIFIVVFAAIMLGLIAVYLPELFIRKKDK